MVLWYYAIFIKCESPACGKGQYYHLNNVLHIGFNKSRRNQKNIAW